MNRERLEYMIEILEAVARADKKQGHKHFDLNAWIMNGGIAEGREVRATCGTVACAFGWMCMSKKGKADGLYLRPDPTNIYWTPVYRNKNNYHAAAAYFSIPYLHARYLFSPSEYREQELQNPRAVVKRIRELLEQQ